MLVPEYLLRFVAWVASRLVYRFKVRGEEHIPTHGAAVLVCNHVSFIDVVLLMAASPRPIRFLMDHRIFQVPVLGWLFKPASAVPITPQKEDPAVKSLIRPQMVKTFPQLAGAATRFGAFARLLHHPFPGGRALRVPLTAVGALWYQMRDQLGV